MPGIFGFYELKAQSDNKDFFVPLPVSVVHQILNRKSNHILSGTLIPNNPIPVFIVWAVNCANCKRSIFFSSLSAFAMECSA